MKLVIYLTDKRARQTASTNPIELEMDTFLKTSDDLVEYGRVWAKFWSTDIVMLVEEDE